MSSTSIHDGSCVIVLSIEHSHMIVLNNRGLHVKDHMFTLYSYIKFKARMVNSNAYTNNPFAVNHIDRDTIQREITR